MEQARDRFVNLLINYRKIKPHNITVVFDGYKSGAGIEHVSASGGVKIIYSRLNEKADEVIKRILSSDRKKWIVVSDDRDIAKHAWSVNSIPIPSERFFEIVSRQVEQKDFLGHPPAEFLYKDEEDVCEHIRFQKGNPHKLSKKEKAVRRALSNL
jgi:predicted RNA-binding protein with PIN domain